MKLLLAVLIFILHINSFSQGQMLSINTLEDDYSNLDVYTYPEDYFLTIKKIDVSQISNETQEELINSVIQANTLNWINLNEYPAITELSESEVKRIQKLNSIPDVENTKLQLLQRINFIYQSEEYSFIKFRVTIESVGKVVGSYFMKKIGGNWFIFKDSFSKISFWFYQYNYNKLFLSFGQNKSNDYLKNMVESVFEDGKLSIEKFTDFSDELSNKDESDSQYNYFREIYFEEL